MKGVIYARYSSDNQREESIDGQLRECKAFAERNGIDIIGSYIDRAFSAKTDNRPDFQRMIKDSSSKAFDVVLVWKLDRFARDRYDSAYYKRTLRKNGVKVVSATESISEGAEGILLESLLEGIAEYYSVELAEKTLRGMTENALACKVNGSVPLGYVATEDGHYQIDPIFAPIIVEIYQMYLDGMTMKEIVNNLRSRGIRNRKGAEISENVVSNILKNRRYPDLSDEEYETLAEDMNDGYLGDERANLDVMVGDEILVIGDIGRWDGRRMGYKYVESGNISDCLYGSPDCYYCEWFVDRDGEFRSTQIHHDGTNYMYYRKWKDGVSFDERDELIGKLYNGSATMDDIDAVTEKLGRDIGKVYGWYFPDKRLEERTKDRRER